MTLKKVAIDFGIVNMVTLYSPLFERPISYKSNKIITINNRFNKVILGKKILKSSNVYSKCYDPSEKGDIHKLNTQRQNVIHDSFQKMTRDIIERCTQNGVDEIIMGHSFMNSNGERYPIPFQDLVTKIVHHAKINNMKVRIQDENHTSKCDALSFEEVKRHSIYSGKRISRGLYRSKKGIVIDADVNGAINILRKAIQHDVGQTEILRNEIQKIKYIKPQIIVL